MGVVAASPSTEEMLVPGGEVSTRPPHPMAKKNPSPDMHLSANTR